MGLFPVGRRVSAVVGFVFLVALSTHLPDLSTLFPAVLDDSTLPTASQYYFGGGVAVIAILEHNLGDSSATSWRPASRSPWRSAASRPWPPPVGCSTRSAVTTACPGPAGSRRSRTGTARRPTRSSRSSWSRGCSRSLPGVVGGGTAIVIVTAISTIFLYAAYGICIYLGATTQDWLRERVWSLGRWSKPVAWIAVFWVIVLMVLFSFPTSGNICWPFMIDHRAVPGGLLLRLGTTATSRDHGPWATAPSSPRSSASSRMRPRRSGRPPDASVRP